MVSAKESAAEAHSRFTSRNFDGCMDALKACAAATSRSDPKLLQNQAVCKYFQSGFSDVDEFLGDQEKLGEPGLPTRSKHVGAATEALQRLEEREHRALWLSFEGHECGLYNEAVALFHQRRYQEAESKLMPLHRNEGQLSDLLAARVALLLLGSVLAQCFDTRVQHPRGSELRMLAAELVASVEAKRESMQQQDKEQAESKQEGDRSPPMRLWQHAQLLRAHHQAVLGEHTAAMQLLHEYMRDSKEGEQSADWWQQVLYLNNLGVLHMHMGKAQLAALYFGKAASVFGANAKPTGDASSSTMATHPSIAAVMYNSAICSLVRGQYKAAFQAFIVTSHLYHDSPVLWLRLAQCCVRQWEQGVAEAQVQEHKKRWKTGLGSRSVQLPTQRVLRPESGVDAASDEPQMSLQFAEKCLRNAHHLLFRRRRQQRRRSGPRDASPARDRAEQEEDDDRSREPDGPMSEGEIHDALCSQDNTALLLQSVYCNMAYVALCQNNPALSLSSARKLLTLPSARVYREHKVVCLSYCVEALCALNKPQEALAMLNETRLEFLLQGEPSALKLPARGFPPTRASCTSETPSLLESPIYLGTPSDRDHVMLTRRHAEALFTNLCVVHIMSGKFGKAQQCLDQCKADAQPVTHLLQVYLHLAQGRRQEAINLVSRCPPLPPYF
eukprot:TRINITY_DN32116_c0_g1_i1.p1 TRINITY_DN32116_c0_g1~~TRINITY_DN32116_c0_g1_i1.p1  ORF type:complete len:670 (+),score=235.18 TRINITY_DN32116_c0_g1_i1:132-2141(+)